MFLLKNYIKFTLKVIFFGTVFLLTCLDYQTDTNLTLTTSKRITQKMDSHLTRRWLL